MDKEGIACAKALQLEYREGEVLCREVEFHSYDVDRVQLFLSLLDCHPPQIEPLGCCSDSEEILYQTIPILAPIPSWWPLAGIGRPLREVVPGICNEPAWPPAIGSSCAQIY